MSRFFYPRNTVSWIFNSMTAGLTIRTWIGSSTVALAPPKRRKTRNPCGCGLSLYSCGFAGFLHQKNMQVNANIFGSCNKKMQWFSTRDSTRKNRLHAEPVLSFLAPPHCLPPDTRHGANFIRVSEHSEGRKKRKVSTKWQRSRVSRRSNQLD